MGLGILLIRRENRDLFLLAWLISFYLILHRDLAGKATFLHRSLSASAHIFAPITVIGAVSIASLIKLPQNYKSFLKFGLSALVVVLALTYNFPKAYATLSTAYNSPFARLNPAEIDVSEWLQNNIDESQNVSIIGVPPQLLQKVWWMSSYSHRTSMFFEGFLSWKTYAVNRNETVKYHLMNDYLVLDYSDIGRLQDQSSAQQWQKFEQTNLASHKLLYNKDNIKVYKYENS